MTITGLSSGNDKPYDSTTEAEPQGTPALNGKVSGDVVTFATDYPKYHFASKAIGNNKAIMVTANLAGTDAGNYEVQSPTGLTQTVEVGVTFNAGTKTVTGLKSKYASTTKIGIPASIGGVDVDNIKGFAYNTKLKQVIIDDGAKKILRIAFSNCRYLTSLRLPNSLTTIEFGAFSSCVALTYVIIPDSVTYIGIGSFYKCTKLVVKVITSNQNKITLGAYAFGDSRWVKQIQVPSASLRPFKWRWSKYASIMVGY